MKISLGPSTTPVPTPILIIGTYNNDDSPNVMTATWAGVCASSPPSMMVSFRKGRHSLENILKKKAFTINIPNFSQLSETDYYGLISGTKEDKLLKTGMEVSKAEFVDAPCLVEVPLVMECVYKTHIEVGSHIMVVSEVLDVKADENLVIENKLVLDNGELPLYDQSTNKYRDVGEIVGNSFSIGKKYLK